MKRGARRGTGRSWMRSLGVVGAAAVAVMLAFSSAAPASAAFQGDVSERINAGLGERLEDFFERVQRWRDRPPEEPGKPQEPGKPPVAETPELGSLLLFGSGAAGMAGYAVTRLRQRRPGG
jgi:hypothetical protein